MSEPADEEDKPVTEGADAAPEEGKEEEGKSDLPPSLSQVICRVPRRRVA